MEMTLLADLRTRSISGIMGTTTILLLLVMSTLAQDMMEEEEMLNKEWIKSHANCSIDTLFLGLNTVQSCFFNHFLKVNHQNKYKHYLLHCFGNAPSVI